MNDKDGFEAKLKDWEYCYCRNCRRIRACDDLTVTEEGVCCTRCGGTDLEAPGWVECPHQKGSAVKCPRSGKGITSRDGRPECLDRCHFRDVPRQT